MGEKRIRMRIVLAVGLSFVAGTGFAQAVDGERPYLDQVQTAMDRMMAGMMTAPTGDVDRDFVRMMRPHHQGAIDMSVAVLRYGRSEQLKRIAQEIIVDQQQEIAAMNLAIGEPLPPSAPVPTQPGSTDLNSQSDAHGDRPHHHQEH